MIDPTTFEDVIYEVRGRAAETLRNRRSGLGSGTIRIRIRGVARREWHEWLRGLVCA